MEPRLNLVTLGVTDLPRAVAFYRDALGWRMSKHSGGDIAFFQAGGVVLALYPRPLLAEDARVPDRSASDPGFGGITLAQNVRAREDVDRVLAEAAAAGARILKPAEDAFWGGRSGYFADPDGYPWEVAWGSVFQLDEEGIVRLEPRTPAAQPRKAAAAAGETATPARKRAAAPKRRPAREGKKPARRRTAKAHR